MASLAVFSTVFKDRKSATDAFAQKKFLEALRTRPILKILARLLPELYSTRSNYYYKLMISSNMEVKHTFRHGHVIDDVIALTLQENI